MKKLDELILNAKTIALGGHVRPDGDCIGSMTAMYKYIKKFNPEICVDSFCDKIPGDLMFMVPEDFLIRGNASDEYDLFIALDAADKERLGCAEMYFDKAKFTLCIDHHKSNDGYADINIIEPLTGSASEVLFTLMDEEKIDKDIAVSVYTGMAHDTGVFQYSNTSPDTMRIAARMMEYGIEFSSIIEDSFYSKSFIQNKLLGYCLGKSELILDSHCIITVVSIAEYEALGATNNDFEGIVSQLRNTREPEIAVVLYETEPDVWKASLRSKGRVNLIPITQANGGGGHILAAGCTLHGDEKSVYAKIVSDIKNNL